MKMFGLFGHLVLGSVLLYCATVDSQGVVTRCSSMLRDGGYCSFRANGCMQGSFQYTPLSNFLGCYRTDQVCCAFLPGQGRANSVAPVFAAPPRTCGQGSGALGDRILNGRITGQCDWPFVVSIRSRRRNNPQLTYADTLPACAGVLIANNWVLTSPYCLLSAGSSALAAPQNILVVAGEYNVSQIDIDPRTGRQQEQLITVERAIIHPDYRFSDVTQIAGNPNSLDVNSNAVALLKLRVPINGQCSGVACLPDITEANNPCAAYDNCVITGWGFKTESVTRDNFVNILNVGQVRLASRVACDFLSQRLNLLNTRPVGTTCQGPLNTITDGCLGDEGGAILCNTNGRNWVVRGIIPFNICVNNRYELFVTEVSPYLTWIQQTMAQF